MPGGAWLLFSYTSHRHDKSGICTAGIDLFVLLCEWMGKSCVNTLEKCALLVRGKLLFTTSDDFPSSF